MKLSTREDIEAPLEHVFAALTDNDRWETAAMRRGADVTRADKLRVTGAGMAWRVKFDYRGKPRDLEIKLTEYEPLRLVFAGSSVALDGVLTLDLMALAPRRTRVIVATEIKPRTLGARLVLQSLKLAKAKLMRRFEDRVARIAGDISERYDPKTHR